MRVFGIVFLIFGTVVGSGFSSGKEIFVYFSRFGIWSFFYIFLACIMFFMLFYFFLKFGGTVVKKIEHSKMLNVIIALLSLVFSASMFAGMESLFRYFPQWLYALVVAILLFSSLIVVQKGVKGLEKANLVLMPLASVVFFVVLIVLSFKSCEVSFETNALAGLLYSPLYVALNCSMGGIVIAKSGEGLTKKQTVLISLFSCLLIFVFLILGNFVLQHNPDCFFSDMPFLTLSQKNSTLFVLTYLVILIGCFTTLISMCFTLKDAFAKIVKHQFSATGLSVFVPFLVSGLGFSQIVLYVYPLASVFGIFVLLFLIFEGVRTK